MNDAGVAQLVEHLLPMQDVTGSSPVARSKFEGHTFSNGTHIWSVSRLIELSAHLVPEEVLVDSFGELDSSTWWEDDYPTVREVVEHTRRILAADLNYPIIVSAEGMVMDGCHRLAKALLEGRSTIKQVQFAVTPPPDGQEET